MGDVEELVVEELLDGADLEARDFAVAKRGGVEAHFVGFLPHKSGQRRKKLEELRSFAGTLVLYESAYRIEKLLAELNEVFPGRSVVLARELTKKFEEFLRGTPAQLLEVAKKRPLKGEFVVLIDSLRL